VIESPWLTVSIGAAVAALVMVVLWLIEVRIRDASHVDVGWAYLVGTLGVLYAVVADGDVAHRVLVGVLAAIWSLRLGTYLLVNRVLGKPEDGRYRDLRERWRERGHNVNARFLVFFQAQALLAVTFAIPLLLAAYNPTEGLEPLEIAGAFLWATGVAGTTLADVQLARWRDDSTNRGLTCRAGLWRLSRHPNYFFEWLVWVAFAMIATPAPWGWLGWLVPALLLFLLFRVTGIPATEAQALRSRGDDYRRYQSETSVFVPWFPRRIAT
jgi:steroid 5-alpha reductase family enzyme